MHVRPFIKKIRRPFFSRFVRLRQRFHCALDLGGFQFSRTCDPDGLFSCSIFWERLCLLSFFFRTVLNGNLGNIGAVFVLVVLFVRSGFLTGRQVGVDLACRGSGLVIVVLSLISLNRFVRLRLCRQLIRYVLRIDRRSLCFQFRYVCRVSCVLLPVSFSGKVF